MNDNENVVYIIKNDFNDKVYVGVTNNLKRRMYQHSRGTCAEHSPIDRSILIHGWNHFHYEILDHYIDLEDRRTKEIYYIRLYDSFHNGYNANEGGDIIVNYDTKGEKNPRAQITEQDVIDIRKRRMNGERLDSVYEDYRDKMSGGKRSGFSKVWLHESWPDVCKDFVGHYPEIDTKYYASVKKNLLTEKEYENLLEYFMWNGPLSRYNAIYNDYYKSRCDWETFQNYCKQIVETLYGKKSTRRYRQKIGQIDKMISSNREKLVNEPKLLS